MIADHGDQIIEYHDLPHAREAPGLCVVNLFDFASEHGTRHQGRDPHSRRHDVDAEERLTVDLVRRIEPRDWPALVPGIGGWAIAWIAVGFTQKGP